MHGTASFDRMIGVVSTLTFILHAHSHHLSQLSESLLLSSLLALIASGLRLATNIIPFQTTLTERTYFDTLSVKR
ncbi:hypothetical protein BKA70DRAFT_1315600 [Coprinopsis sp. MPI-PUGE-AT-0042]|nr:hypothetical protein BKA70DRAFT_1315600 [Coprinopsis sp. MPI-PUGE-AT-0042]